MKMIKITSIAIIFLALLSCNAFGQQELRFGVYTSDKPTAMYKKFSPIMDYIEAEMARKNMPVNIEFNNHP